MKLAIICYKGFGSDGISAFILNNYRLFDHKKLHCTLIYSSFFGDVDVAKEKLSEFDSNGDISLCIPKNNGIIKYFFHLVGYLKENKFDAVHIHGSSASIVLEALASKFAGVKRIITHSHNTTGNHAFIHRICRFFLNRIVTCPLACGEEAGFWMYGKNKRYQIIPNGIDLYKYEFREDVRCAVRKRLNVASNQILVGHVGGFNAQKNQKFLIDILHLAKKRNMNIRLILIGKGKFQESLMKYASLLGVVNYVSFLGQRSDVNELMMGMDAFFLPSFFEGFPIVGVEAQASGLPTFMADTISKESALTDLVRWLPINEGPECWLNALQVCGKVKNRMLYAERVAQQGFDVKESSSILQNIYLGK